MARPQKNIDDDLLCKLVTLQVPVSRIAKYFNCHRDSIYAKHGDFIRKGRGDYYIFQKEVWKRNINFKQTTWPEIFSEQAKKWNISEVYQQLSKKIKRV